MKYREVLEAERTHKIIRDQQGDTFKIVGHKPGKYVDDPLIFIIQQQVLGVPRKPIDVDVTTVLCMEVVEK